MPVLTQLGDALLTAGFGAFGALLAAALMARIRRVPAWAVPIVPAAVFALAFVIADNASTAPSAFVVALLAGYAVWQHGVITGIIAIGSCMIVANALPLVMTDLTVFRASGVLLVAIALLPLAAAVLTWQKLGPTTRSE
jgi:hypothetical protein